YADWALLQERMLMTAHVKLSENHQETRPSFAAVVIVVLLCAILCGSTVAPNLLVAQSSTSKPITGVAVARTAKMVLIHGGTFEMGTDASNIPRLQRLYGVGRADLFSAEVPGHTVTVSPFSIDAHAVTNAKFKSSLTRIRSGLRSVSPQDFITATTSSTGTATNIRRARRITRSLMLAGTRPWPFATGMENVFRRKPSGSMLRAAVSTARSSRGATRTPRRRARTIPPLPSQPPL